MRKDNVTCLIIPIRLHSKHFSKPSTSLLLFLSIALQVIHFLKVSLKNLLKVSIGPCLEDLLLMISFLPTCASPGMRFNLLAKRMPKSLTSELHEKTYWIKNEALKTGHQWTGNGATLEDFLARCGF
jgi:hypothetical protein